MLKVGDIILLRPGRIGNVVGYYDKKVVIPTDNKIKSGYVKINSITDKEKFISIDCESVVYDFYYSDDSYGHSEMDYEQSKELLSLLDLKIAYDIEISNRTVVGRQIVAYNLRLSCVVLVEYISTGSKYSMVSFSIYVPEEIQDNTFCRPIIQMYKGVNSPRYISLLPEKCNGASKIKESVSLRAIINMIEDENNLYRKWGLRSYPILFGILDRGMKKDKSYTTKTGERDGLSFEDKVISDKFFISPNEMLEMFTDSQIVKVLEYKKKLASEGKLEEQLEEK